MLSPWGEDIIKRFVHEAIDETLKLETALATLRSRHRVALLHYSPLRRPSRGSRWKSCHSSDAAGWRSRSTVTASPSPFMATPITGRSKVERAVECRSTTYPCPCCGGNFPNTRRFFFMNFPKRTHRNEAIMVVTNRSSNRIIVWMQGIWHRFCSIHVGRHRAPIRVHLEET